MLLKIQILNFSAFQSFNWDTYAHYFTEMSILDNTFIFRSAFHIDLNIL